jgi:hypothetical protein
MVYKNKAGSMVHKWDKSFTMHEFVFHHWNKGDIVGLIDSVVENKLVHACMVGVQKYLTCAS